MATKTQYSNVTDIHASDEYKVYITSVTSHNITIKWKDPVPEDSFQIIANPANDTQTAKWRYYYKENPNKQVSFFKFF